MEEGRLEPGSRALGRYEIVGLRGSGGFGQVYEAIQHPIGRRVALKVLALRDEVSRQRFVREARAASRVEHPAVVTIHDIGELDDGRPALVMSWLEGHDLGRELAGVGPLSPARCARLLIDCLEGLALAHAQGIVHRDLKPANLFLTWPGQGREALVLLDFGIAAITRPPGGLTDADTDELGDAMRLTSTGVPIGTPRYLAPEYLEHQRVSPALDVYQLGLIMAEAITGRPAVRATQWWSCVAAHIAGALELPDHTRAGALAPVIARASALAPEARYRDAAALREALLAVVPLLDEGARVDSLVIPALPPALDTGPVGALDTAAPRPAPTAPVRVEAGTFWMGSPPDEPGRGDDEARHPVTLTRPLLVMPTPVTQRMWRSVTGHNPSQHVGDDRPVENVSWWDAVAFANLRSRQEGLTECYFLDNARGTPGLDFACDGVFDLGDCDGWRLPTEAEWEYFARAGASGACHGPSLEEVAWIGANSDGASQPVARKCPNSWGIYDVLGNVWEWAWGWYAPLTSAPEVDPAGPAQGAYRVARGGSWRSVAWAARLANRTRHGPDHRYSDTGLRLVRLARP